MLKSSKTTDSTWRKKLELKQGRRKIGSYDAAGLSNFRAIKPDKPLESEIEAILEVVAPVLEGQGMWRFKYGRMSITAKWSTRTTSNVS